MKITKLKKKPNVIGMLTIATALAVSLNACSKEYSADAIEGWVVDAETGKPLEGVIVTANWQVEEGTFAGTSTGNQLQILETVTDKAGRYYFPAWGPKPLPPKRSGKSVDQYVGHEDPRLLFFKGGYGYATKFNQGGIERNNSTIRRSDWNGKKIELKRFDDQSEAYGEALWRAETLVAYALGGEHCEWQQIPHLLGTMIKEGNRLSKLGINKGQISIESIPQGGPCAPPREFLREFLK